MLWELINSLHDVKGSSEMSPRMLSVPSRVAGPPLTAALVQYLPSRVGQHKHGCGKVPDVHARQLCINATEPWLHPLWQRHLCLLLGIHPLQSLHHRHLRA